MIDSYGGTSYGPGACASCYVSFSNTLNIVGVPGVVYTGTTNSSMICNMAGTFWATGLSDYFEIAYTQDLFTNVETNCVTSDRTGITYCDYLVAPSCTFDTSPPDLNPTAIEGSDLFPDPQYYDVKGLGIRLFTFQRFTFLNIDTYATEVYSPRLPAICTKNNPY